MQTDPVADMLTIIRNGYISGKKSVMIPHSGFVENILKIIKEEGYIEDMEIVTKRNRPALMATLRYLQHRKPALEGIKRISRPGRRVYAERKKIPYVRNGFGVAILSTSRGVMTDKKARARGVGGEVVCEVW
jgi:small subunit ribosomal protein S8